MVYAYAGGDGVAGWRCACADASRRAGTYLVGGMLARDDASPVYALASRDSPFIAGTGGQR